LITLAAALEPTPTIDSQHPAVLAFVARHRGVGNEREQAIRLYYAVRDEIRYDPYSIVISSAGLSASRVLGTGLGWCVSKAVLLAACCRASGIPARIGFADVRNHLSTERMRALMQTNEFRWHGYTSILLDGQWRKATPAFNLSLCEKFRIRPLEFDGTTDSIYHPYDMDGREHMEYLRYRGEFIEVPIAEMSVEFARIYPRMMAAMTQGNFDAEVASETAPLHPALPG